MVPEKCTREEFAAFLLVADKYKLNPILKEIYAFPKKGGGIQPIVSVDGWSNIINSHPACDGFDFEDHLGEDGNLMAITCRIYRKDRSRPTETREYMAECVQPHCIADVTDCHADLRQAAAMFETLAAERAKLTAFSRQIIRYAWDGAVDGQDVQDAAEEHGLIARHIATAEDANTNGPKF